MKHIALTLAACLGAAGCSSTCLNIYGGETNSLNPISVFVSTDGGAGNTRPNPVVVTELAVWINSEVRVVPFAGPTARILVNGQEVKRVTFNKEIGLKSSGRVELAPHMSPGVNAIEVRISYGKSDDGSIIRGSRRAEGKPFSGLPHECYESEGKLDVKPTSFSVDYRPTGRMAAGRS